MIINGCQHLFDLDLDPAINCENGQGYQVYRACNCAEPVIVLAGGHCYHMHQAGNLGQWLRVSESFDPTDPDTLVMDTWQPILTVGVELVR